MRCNVRTPEAIQEGLCQDLPVADVECGATFGPPRVPTRRFQPPTLIGLQRSAAGAHSIAATGTVPPANVDPRAACERPRARHVAPAECIATRTDLTAAASCRTLEPYRTSSRKQVRAP